MNTKKQKNSSIAITFYVIAVLMLIVMAFEIYLTQKSLASQMESYGITFADEWQTIIFGYYFSAQNLLPLTAALMCYGIGHIINKIQFTQDALMACLQDAEANTKDVEENEELNLEELEAERKKTKAANETKGNEEGKETVDTADTKEEATTEEAKKEEPKKKKTTAKKKTTKKEEVKQEEVKADSERTETKEVGKTEEASATEEKKEEVKEEKKEETKA